MSRKDDRNQHIHADDADRGTQTNQDWIHFQKYACIYKTKNPYDLQHVSVRELSATFGRVSF